MAVRFNVPPGWPTPPLSWTPREDWLPDPTWPDPPAGWSFWTPVLDGGGALTVADRAALQAELASAEHGAYGCTVVTWWTAAGEVAAPPPAPCTPPTERRPATQVSPTDAPRQRTATVRRRGLLIAAVVVCALGLVGFQASRILFVSDSGDGEEIPKPLPVSDTRVPTTDLSRTSAVTAPAVPTTPPTDRPELVAATVASSPSITSSASVTPTASGSASTTGRTGTLAPTTAAAVPTARTNAPAATKRAPATAPAARTSSPSTRTAPPKSAVPARPPASAPSTSVVPATASAVPAGGGRS